MKTMSEYLCPYNPAEGNAKEEVKLFMLKKKKKKEWQYRVKEVKLAVGSLQLRIRNNYSHQGSGETGTLCCYLT